VIVRCPYGSGKPQWLALSSFHPPAVSIAADFQIVALLGGVRFGVRRAKAAFLCVFHPAISLPADIDRIDHGEFLCESGVLVRLRRMKGGGNGYIPVFMCR
jgi:hypothetical protein